MRAEIPLAAAGIVIAGVAAVLWKSPDISVPSPAANGPAQSVPAEKPPAASRQVRSVIENAPAQLLAGIRKALASTDPNERDIALPKLLAALVRADPLTAARFAETNNPGETHDLLLNRVAQLWAAQDAPATLDWATKLKQVSERDAILTDVCLQVAETNPEEAIQIHSRHVTGRNSNTGLEALAQRWAESDFPAARAWALSRDAGEERDQLVARLAFVESQTAPFDAATLAAEKIPAGRVQNEAVMAVLHQWALRDPTAAEAWVAGFPAGDLRTRAVNELDSIARSSPQSKR